MRHPAVVLAVLCAATYAILLDTSIVNVALPTLVNDLGATTTDLKWIVDAYNLAFAALVLAGGSLSDRYGRKGTLMLGLSVFALGNVAASLVDTTGSLITTRALMGVGAALIFPTTLSIITNVFVERRARARAIGIWGAMTGLGVASGPIVGGWLLEFAWWGSLFAFIAAVAVVALLAVGLVVPTSRDPEAPPLDIAGLVLSTLALGVLVFTIIEAPERGWSSISTLGGFTVAGVLFAGFVAVEGRRRHPMLDTSLFANPRFSAASGSVTVAFFALFGFIFLITQYFQFVRGYTPLESGLRILPVATCIALAAITGTKLAVTVGNTVVVAGGLALMSLGFAWVSIASSTTPYLEIVGQMVLLGLGLGFTSAPATEAVMGAVPPDKAGQGSAVNDATREVGGTLGIAVIGSVFATVYGTRIADDETWAAVPADARAVAEDGLGLALRVTGEVGSDPVVVEGLTASATSAFLDGLTAGCITAAAVTAVGAVVAAIVLPARPGSIDARGVGRSDT